MKWTARPAIGRPDQRRTSVAGSHPSGARSFALAPEVVLVLIAALFVQVVFPYRHDWPAHLAAGGGGVLVIAAVTPSQVGRWVGPLAYSMMAVLGGIAEHLYFGPPDLVDVSFTLAGSLVTLDAAMSISSAGATTRGHAAAWGIALIVASLGYRYSMSIGPT